MHGINNFWMRGLIIYSDACDESGRTYLCELAEWYQSIDLGHGGQA